MAPSNKVPWSDVALAALNAGAQALLDANEVKLVGSAPDFGQVDQLMREIAQKTFLQTYGYQFIPNETVPPLMKPGTFPFVIENNAVQDSDDSQNVTDYVTAAVRNSFLIQGVESQLVQNIVALITAYREQGTTNMQADPKQYVLQGTDPTTEKAAWVQFDGVTVWANLEDQGKFYTIVRFNLVHYQLRDSEQIQWQVGSSSPEVLKGGEMQLHRVGATGKVRLSLCLAGRKKAHLVLTSVDTSGLRAEAEVSLNCDRPGVIWEGDRKPNSEFLFFNLPISGPVILNFRNDHQGYSGQKSVLTHTNNDVKKQLRSRCS